jgi:hypothetical protein
MATESVPPGKCIASAPVRDALSHQPSLIKVNGALRGGYTRMSGPLDLAIQLELVKVRWSR